MLQIVEHLFLTQDIRHLSGISEKIKVLAHRFVLPTSCISKRVIVEIVIRLLELVSKPIIGILKVNSVFLSMQEPRSALYYKGAVGQRSITMRLTHRRHRSPLYLL